MDERERLERNRAAYDPATPGESATIHYTMTSVLTGIRDARRMICGIRVSNETQDALESLERARLELDAFIRRED